jgi:hypothetical protein
VQEERLCEHGKQEKDTKECGEGAVFVSMAGRRNTAKVRRARTYVSMDKNRSGRSGGRICEHGRLKSSCRSAESGICEHERVGGS